MLNSLWRTRLEKADIVVNGSRPWDPQIKDGYETRLMARFALWGTLGLNEAYMDGWWECDDLTGFYVRGINAGGGSIPTLDEIKLAADSFFFNLQKGEHAFDVAKQHYDKGNDLFKVTLDPTLTYTCAFWPPGVTSLMEAQKVKRRHTLAKLKPQKGMTLLEIGCGWGYFAKDAAEAGMRVTGITVSKEQAEFARELCKDLDVRIHLLPYEHIPAFFDAESFDRVVSVGMYEHVGTKNYREFAENVAYVLAPGGLEVRHTIVRTPKKEVWIPRGNPWLHKYIFRGGVLPSMAEIAKANEGLLVCQHMENFGLHYARTLKEWRKNYINGYPSLDHKKYDERFDRMWRCYFCMSEAVFLTGEAQLGQFVHSKGALDSVYVPPPPPHA